MTTIYESLARRSSRRKSISGLFWLQPEAQQIERIRALAQQFNVEQIATIVRRSLHEVRTIIEAAR